MPTDISNWMSRVNSATKLSEISIPGTHNSAARYIDPTLHKGNTSPRLSTQTAGIREQMDAGIRFLDIRVGYTKNAFTLYHESVSLGLGFTQLLEICKTFLDSHRGETIIMSVKKESGAPTSGNHSRVTFQARFNQYVAADPSLWYVGTTIPVLRDVRRKIVLFRRFALDSAAPAGLGIDAFDGFPNDTTGALGNPPRLVVQDKYDQTGTTDSKAAKWAAVAKLLNVASGAESDPGLVGAAVDASGVLFVNYSSAAGVVPVDFPLSVANYVNPRLATYFTTHPRGRFGIVAMDFQTVELNTAIVLSNGG